MAANPDLAVAAAAETEARARRPAAAAGRFPRLDVAQGWQRGNEPVFVFGSLLGQRRFAEANFAIAALNHPDPVNSLRTAVTLSQPIFDGGATRAVTRGAAAAEAIASAARDEAAGGVAAAVAHAYGQALVGDASVRAAAAAIESAVADLERARARDEEGLLTAADVLAIEVHLAQMRARHISASADAQIARATLNRLMGAALDRAWELADIVPGRRDRLDVAAAESAALLRRPDVAATRFRVDAAAAEALGARARLAPRVDAQAGYEWNSATWRSGASSWLVGVTAHWSMSLRGAEAANVVAARHALTRARAEQARTETAARLDVRVAAARLEESGARLDAAAAVIAQARESERVIRDRYGAGLATVTDVLRAAKALLDAEALHVSARADGQVAAVMLDRALGRITGVAP